MFARPILIMPDNAGVSHRPLTAAVVGFMAGALSVLIFHQGMLALLQLLDVTSRGPYPMQPTEPFGVPQVLSLAFWGGVWGVLLMLAVPRRAGRYWLAALAFGAILPTLVAWFLVAPLKGQPIAAGWKPLGMLTGILVNGAWGLGTALLASLVLPRRSRRSA